MKPAPAVHVASVARAAVVWIAMVCACGGGARRETAPEQPHEGEVIDVRPDATLERRLRADAAQYIGCSAALISLTMMEWAGKQGRYRAGGCGFTIEYIVGCDAPDRCGYTQAPSE